MEPRWKNYPQLGSTHKNGDRMYGFASAFASDLMAAGTPAVSSLLKSSVTPEIQRVDIGDELDVIFLGDLWMVRKAGEDVGRLTWVARRRGSPDPRNGTTQWNLEDGVLHVERVTVNLNDEVVDIGGYVTPRGDAR